MKASVLPLGGRLDRRLFRRRQVMRVQEEIEAVLAATLAEVRLQVRWWDAGLVSW